MEKWLERLGFWAFARIGDPQAAQHGRVETLGLFVDFGVF
jgi:hypothetical protein